MKAICIREAAEFTSGGTGYFRKDVNPDSYELMSTTPYRVHLLAYTLGNPLNDKYDIAFWGVYTFVLDKLREGDEV